MAKAKKAVRRRYGPKASQDVELAMHEMKRGTLRSGRSGKKVTSREQAIAIGLSEARRDGAKVPRRAARASSKETKKRAGRRRTKRAT
jgi:hypothetical protein